MTHPFHQQKQAIAAHIQERLDVLGYKNISAFDDTFIVQTNDAQHHFDIRADHEEHPSITICVETENSIKDTTAIERWRVHMTNAYRRREDFWIAIASEHEVQLSELLSKHHIMARVWSVTQADYTSSLKKEDSTYQA